MVDLNLEIDSAKIDLDLAMRFADRAAIRDARACLKALLDVANGERKVLHRMQRFETRHLQVGNRAGRRQQALRRAQEYA